MSSYYSLLLLILMNLKTMSPILQKAVDQLTATTTTQPPVVVVDSVSSLIDEQNLSTQAPTIVSDHNVVYTPDIIIPTSIDTMFMCSHHVSTFLILLDSTSNNNSSGHNNSRGHNHPSSNNNLCPDNSRGHNNSRYVMYD